MLYQAFQVTTDIILESELQKFTNDDKDDNDDKDIGL